MAFSGNTEITIHFNLDGGIGDFPDMIRTTDDRGLIELALPQKLPIRMGYAFAGWLWEGDPTRFSMDEPGKRMILKPSKTELELFACWETLGDVPPAAPYMMATPFFKKSYGYDIFIADWMCMQDAPDTYWAIHNWYEQQGKFVNISHGSGYAGFQNVSGSHRVILSIWDTGCGQPRIECGWNAGTETFSGEGKGVHVVSPYPWKAGVWYSMKVQVRSDRERSYYELSVREAGKDWQLISAISLPRPGLTFPWDTMFQEDFGRNNRVRSCRVRNFYARRSDTRKWESCSRLWISNHDMCETEKQNVRYDCDVKSLMDGRELWIRTGGGGYEDICGLELPCWVDNRQENEPK